MENFSWEKSKIVTMDVELTNICNAACPLCPRFVHTSPVLRSNVKLNQISLEQFKKWFDKSFIFGLKKIVFCGTHGEPTMAKDFLKILDYIRGINFNCVISVNTNGGAHDKHFWEKLGYILDRKKDRVIFSIDGLEDTNHLYRRKVKWLRLMENAKAYISTGRPAIWDFLEFKHNEHQVETARELAHEIGFSEFRAKNALGFEAGIDILIRYRPVYNTSGDYVYKLEPSTKRNLKFIEPNFVEKISIKDHDIKDVNMDMVNSINLEPYNDQAIHCQSRVTKKTSAIYVNCNGIVYPCCFVGTHADSQNDLYQTYQLNQKLNSFNFDKFNLNNNSIESIEKSLDLVYKDSWSKDSIEDGKLLSCVTTCGKQNILDFVYKLDEKKRGIKKEIKPLAVMKNSNNKGKQFCQISSCMRTGSTFLNSIVHSYNPKCNNLSELFSIHNMIIPHHRNSPDIYNDLQFIIAGEDMIGLVLVDNFKKFNELISDNWDNNWYYRIPELRNGKIIFNLVREPRIFNTYSKKYYYNKVLDLIKNATEPFIFKLFSIEVMDIEKVIGIDFIKFIEDAGIELIGLTRDSFSDICLSKTISDFTKNYNTKDSNYIDYKKQEEYLKTKIITSSEGTFNFVKRCLQVYNELLKRMKNATMLEYEELTDTGYILKKLGLDYNKHKSTHFTKKLYPNLTKQNKLDMIINLDEFIFWCNKYEDKIK